MGSDGIFMIRDGQLAVLRDSPYETEEILQRALADFPDVLAGGTTSAEEDRPLLLIGRERGVPTAAEGSSVFSLDHLFVDPDGVPVIVEVKRSTDTRIRREVVGQMLDYAANGVKYWPVAELRRDFEATFPSAFDADARVVEVSDSSDVEDFWERVEQNLRSGHIRMVFVADRLPGELVRIIEFLNEQMSPAEVLGVEVRQFVDGDTQVLVPRLVGATTAARASKERSSGTAWTEQTFMGAAEDRCDDHEQRVAQRLLDHAASFGTKRSWGRGATPGVTTWYTTAGSPRPVVNINLGDGSKPGTAQAYLYLPELHEALSPIDFAAFLAGVREIRSFDEEIDSGRRKYPAVSLADLGDDDVRALLAAIESLAPATAEMR